MVDRRDQRLKIFIAIVTAAVGCLVIAPLNQFGYWAVGFINLALAVAIATQNAFKFQERAEKFRTGAAALGALLREIDVIRSLSVMSRGDARGVLTSIKNRWDAIVGTLPLIEPKIWAEMKDQIARPKEQAIQEMKREGLIT